MEGSDFFPAKRMMVSNGGEIHEECPDCRGECSPYQPMAATNYLTAQAIEALIECGPKQDMPTDADLKHRRREQERAKFDREELKRLIVESLKYDLTNRDNPKIWLELSQALDYAEGAVGGEPSGEAMTALEFSKIWDAPMRRDHTMYSVAFAEAYALEETERREKAESRVEELEKALREIFLKAQFGSREGIEEGPKHWEVALFEVMEIARKALKGEKG